MHGARRRSAWVGKLDVLGSGGGRGSENVRCDVGIELPIGEHQYMTLLQLIVQVDRPEDCGNLSSAPIQAWMKTRLVT